MLVCAKNHRNFNFQGGLCWFVLKGIETAIFKVVCAGLCWFVLVLCWFVVKSIVSSINEKVCAGLC